MSRFHSSSAGPSNGEFAGALACAELFTDDSPSTSGASQVVALPAHARVARRSATPERLLNNNYRTCIYNRIDPKLQLDYRTILNLMQLEELLQPNYHYFTAVQEHITPYHREQAVEWIYDVAKEEKCDGDVLPQAVAILDRFLSSQNIFKHDIQMVAGVALFIASKLKATHPLNANKIVYYSDNSCQMHDILSWELLMVTQLDWETESPTAFDFFDQLMARLPPISTLRHAFQNVVHRCQKMHKLATLFPSMQCALALYYVANNSCLDAQLANGVKNLIHSIFQLDLTLLDSYLPMVARCLATGSVYANEQQQQQQGMAPLVAPTPFQPPETVSASTSRVSPPSVVLDKVPESHMTPTTPLNDSGFCSDVSSPESAEKKRRRSSFLEDDVTPPKMLRMI